MSKATLTAEQRKQIMEGLRNRLAKIDTNLLRDEAVNAPGGLADVERSLDSLADCVSHCTADRIEPYLLTIMDRHCPTCPYQEVSGACPFRTSRMCLIVAHPRAIVEAIQTCLTPLQPSAISVQTNRKDPIMFKRILVAVDDSEAQSRVVRLSKGLASQCEARVALVHVIPIPMAIPPSTVFEGAEVEATLRRAADELLEKVRGQFEKDGHVEVFAPTGRAGDEIIGLARIWKADLIIVGDRNRSGISRFLLGSTAEMVTRHAPCPVLVARDLEKTETVPVARSPECVAHGWID